MKSMAEILADPNTGYRAVPLGGAANCSLYYIVALLVTELDSSHNGHCAQWRELRAVIARAMLLVQAHTSQNSIARSLMSCGCRLVCVPVSPDCYGLPSSNCIG